MASNPHVRPEQVRRTASRRRTGSSSTTRRATTRSSTGRSPGSTRRARRSSSSPRSPGCRAATITPAKTIDDKGRYSYPTDPERFFTQRQQRACTAGSTCSQALTVSSDVYFYTIGGDLYYRQRHNIAGRRRAAGRRPASSGSARRPASRSRTRPAGASPTPRGSRRSTTRTRPRSRTPTGCPATTSISAVGQGDMLVTPAPARQRVRHVRRTAGRCTSRGSRRRCSTRTARRCATSRRSRCGQVPVPDRDAMLAGLHRRRRGQEGHRGRTCSPASRPGMVAGKTGTAQVQGKQATSLFVGMTPAAEPAVHRARGRRGGRVRRRDRGARSSAGSCRASTACRSPTW